MLSVSDTALAEAKTLAFSLMFHKTQSLPAYGKKATPPFFIMNNDK